MGETEVYSMIRIFIFKLILRTAIHGKSRKLLKESVALFFTVFTWTILFEDGCPIVEDDYQKVSHNQKWYGKFIRCPCKQTTEGFRVGSNCRYFNRII